MNRTFSLNKKFKTIQYYNIFYSFLTYRLNIWRSVQKGLTRASTTVLCTTMLACDQPT